MNQSLNKNKLNSEEELDLSRFLVDLKAKWYYFLITGIIILSVAVFYIKFSLPVYQASSSILIDDSKSPKGIEDFISSDIFGSATSIQTEIGILESRTVVQHAINQLGLRTEYFNTTSFPSHPIYPNYPFIVKFEKIDAQLQEFPFEVKIIDKDRFQLSFEYDGDDLPEFSIIKTARFGELITDKHFAIQVNKNDSVDIAAKGNTYEFRYHSINKLTGSILENLQVEALDKDADIVKLTYKDVIQQRALDVMNAIGKVYIDLDVQDKASVASLTLKFVDEQMNNTGAALSSTEQDMQQFKEKNKSIDLSEESRVMLQKMNDADVEREKNNIELTSLSNLYQYVSNNADLTNLAPTSLGVPDPLLVQLITNFQGLQSKRKSLSFGVSSSAPAVKVLDEQIAETRASLLENIRNIQNRMMVTRKALQQQIGLFENQVKTVPEKERELLSIQRNFEVNQNIYTYLLQKKAETSIAKATAVSDNKVLDVASLADDPVSPNKKLIVVLIALLSAIIPSAIIIIQGILRNTVNNREDIARITKIPVVGVVGHSSEHTNLAVHLKPKSAISEGFRTIRTNLQFYGLNQGNKVLTISSSVGGEGKSFITINLATVLAMQQNKVVVVGLDLRKPKLFQDFNLKNDIGASNYLVGSASLDQIIRPTTIPNLDIISAGPIPPNPAELLSRKSLQTMIEELKQRYDLVVIDTPPLGIVSDAFVIMPFSDINLYIVRQGYSKLEYLRSLDELYSEGKLVNLSIVLNDSLFSRTGGYGYGHNYGYINGSSGYYEEDHQTGFKKIFKKKATQTS